MDFNIKKPKHIIALLILLFAFFLIIVSPILSFVGYYPSTSDIELSEIVIVISSIFTIFIFVGVPYLWILLVNDTASIKGFLKELNVKIKGLPMALVWAFVAVVLMFAIEIIIGLILYQLGYVNDEVSNVQDLAASLSIGSIIFVVIFQSASEEVFFRGFLLKKMDSLYGKEIAIVLSSVLFGLAHLSYANPYVGVMSALIGVVLGYFYIKTRNLVTVIAAHILFNSASFFLFFIYQSLGFEALIL